MMRIIMSLNMLITQCASRGDSFTLQGINFKPATLRSKPQSFG